MDAPTTTTDSAAIDDVEHVTSPAVETQPLVESDLLVEDVSIDGMCGVY